MESEEKAAPGKGKIKISKDKEGERESRAAKKGLREDRYVWLRGVVAEYIKEQIVIKQSCISLPPLVHNLSRRFCNP